MIDAEKTIRRGLVCLLALTPLLFGTVEFWSLTIMEVFCALLLFLWFSQVLKTGEKSHVKVPPFLAPAVLFLGFAILQILPMPPALIKVLSPSTYLVYSENLSYAKDLPWLTISLYPYATVLEISRFFAYFCIYFLTVQVLNDRRSITKMTKVVLGIGTFIALLGIFQMIFWNGKLLWFRTLNSVVTPFGPYVNRNHFAGLMEMLIPVCTGYLIYLLPRVRHDRGVKDMVSDFFFDTRANQTVLAWTAVVIMSTSLFLSMSRGGIIGLSLSMLFFGSMLWTRDSTRRKGRIIILLFLFVLLSVGWFGWKPVVEKFGRMGRADPSSEYRIMNWKDSLNIVRSYPLFGTGLGTYEHVYPRYKTVPLQERWEHAHNDYVEGAVELGIAGLLLIIYAGSTFFARIFKMLGRRKSLSSRLLCIGAMSGIAGIAVHSLTDFNLHVGANGLFFFFLMGYAVSVSHTKLREEGQESFLKVREIVLPKQVRTPAMVGLVLLCIAVCTVPLLNAGAEIFYSSARGPLGDRSELVSKESRVKKAEVLSPLDARLPFAECTISYALGKKAEAVKECEGAVALNPMNSQYLQLLGIVCDNDARSDSAARYMRLSVLYDPTSAWIHKNYSLWLFSKGEKEAAINQMSEAIALDPDNTRMYIVALVLSKLTQEEIKAAMPENSKALLLYAQYKDELGDTEAALNAYLNAFSVMKRSGRVTADVYHKIIGIYEKRGLLEEALSFCEEGARNNPSDYSLRMRLAGLYEKLNVPYRAKEEYQKVLVMRPFDKDAIVRIKELEKKGQQGDSGVPDAKFSPYN